MARRLLCAVLAAFVAAPVAAQLESVGNLHFENSGSPEAQEHFLRGVAILHSFGWKQAIAEFQAAQKIDPDFALAYWGETLCYNHPLAPEQDGKTPREVLAKLGATPEARLLKAPTPREMGFLRAVEALWTEGAQKDDWRARRVAYMDEMARLHQEFPGDDEVTTFYAVSLLSGAPTMAQKLFWMEQSGFSSGFGHRASDALGVYRRLRRCSSVFEITTVLYFLGLDYRLQIRKGIFNVCDEHQSCRLHSGQVRELPSALSPVS